MTVLYIKYTALSSYFGIKYSMITAEEAIEFLIEVARGEYSENKSYTCVKEFKVSYPSSEKPAFVPDGLPMQIKQL
jgi:hypothetical protein